MQEKLRDKELNNRLNMRDLERLLDSRKDLLDLLEIKIKIDLRRAKLKTLWITLLKI